MPSFSNGRLLQGGRPRFLTRCKKGDFYSGIIKFTKKYYPHPRTSCAHVTLCTLNCCREGAQLLDEVQKGLSDYLETKRSVFALSLIHI